MKCNFPIVVGKQHYTVPCGRCISCRINKTNEWATRIMHEVAGKNAVFVTLTYDDEHLPENGTLVKKDLQDFMKRFRRNLDVKVRYFASGEYGDRFGRPHYHIIIIGVDTSVENIIKKSWNKGFIQVGNVTFSSARYCAKYTVKRLTGERENDYKIKKIISEFSLMSRMPGIGYDTASRNHSVYFLNGYCVIAGKKFPIPRYYKNKFFSVDLLNENQKKCVDLKIKDLLTFQNKYGKNYYEDEKERRKQSDINLRSRTKNRKKGGDING